jgi:hypothetical protein
MIMIALRLLLVLIVSSLVTGCNVSDDIKAVRADISTDFKAIDADIKSLKTDIKMLRNFLASFPTPTQCPDPGVHSSRICHYQFTITKQLDAKKAWYSGQIPKKVVEEAYTGCEAMRKKNSDLENYQCVDPKMYKYWEYAFIVEGEALKEQHTYEFVSNPMTDHLKMVKEVKS